MTWQAAFLSILFLTPSEPLEKHLRLKKVKLKPGAINKLDHK